MAKAQAQITIVDLNDAIRSGTAPANPTIDLLWLDSSGAVDVLKRWNGSAWINQPMSVSNLDPDFAEVVTTLKAAVENAAKDNVISSFEKLNIRLHLLDITGQTLTGTTMPTLAQMDSSKIGEVYTIRAEARTAGMSTTNAAYVGYETAYNNLKSYLDGTNPRAWLTGDTTITASVWSQKWGEYYTALSTLELAIKDLDVTLGKNYNGVTMSTDRGVVVTSSAHETIMNATEGFAIKKKDGTKQFYANPDGKVYANGLVIGSDSTIGGTGVSTVVNNATAGADAKTKIDNLKIGATNLLRNTAINHDTSFFDLAIGITRDTSFLNNGVNTFKYVVSGLTTSQWRAANPRNIPAKPGEVVSASAEVYIPADHGLDADVSIEIQAYNTAGTRIGIYGGNGVSSANLSLTDTWQKLYTTSYTLPADTVGVNARVFIVKNGKCWVSKLKLEKSTTISDWSPSPEDAQSMIDTVTTQENNLTVIEGNKIKTGSIEGKSLKANTVDASKIIVGDFNNFSTADERIADSVLNISETSINSGYLAKSSTAVTTLFLSDYTYNPFKTNEELYYEFDAYATAAGNTTLYVGAYNAAKTLLGSNATANIALTTSVKSFSGTLKLTNANFTASVFSRVGLTASGLDIRVKNVKIYRKSGGHLLVNGSVEAGHISSLNGLDVANGNFVIDNNGNVAIKANITMTGGSITWGSTGVTPPTVGASTSYESGYNPKDTITAVSGNKTTWDRAANINSNGTFETTKLNGKVADSQITSATNWNAAKSAVDDMSNDNKLTSMEKQQLKKEWATISAEKASYEALATTYGFTSEKTNYVTAYNTLNDKLNNTTNGYLLNLTTTTDLGTDGGATFRAVFDDYYDKKAVLVKAINENSRTIATGADTKASTASTNASAAVTTANAASTTASTASTNASNAVTTANNASTAASTANTNASAAVTTANNANTTAGTANTNASAAVTTANAAKSSAEASAASIANMLSDLTITPMEKSSLSIEWNRIKAEYTQVLANAQVSTIAVSTTAFTTAYTALNGTSPKIEAEVLASMTATYTFASTTLRDAFKTSMTTYFTELEKIKKAINDKVNSTATTASSNASAAVSTANAASTTAGTASSNASAAVSTANAASTTAGTASSNASAAVSTANAANATAGTASSNASAAVTTANAAKASAEASAASIGNMLSDLTITPIEKASLYMEWNRIKMEYAQVLATAQIATIAVSASAFTTAYNALNGTSPKIESEVLASMVTTYTFASTTLRDSFKTQFNTYFTELEKIRKGINDKVNSTANTAGTNAQNALNSISDMSNDNKLTPNEKAQLKKEWATISAEKPQYESLATTYAITTTEKQYYVNAYNTLNNRLNNTTDGYLLNLTTTTDLGTGGGATFRAVFDDYYDKKAQLMRKINETSREIGINAQTGANNAAELAKAMAVGKMVHADPTFKSGVNGVAVYNNSANSNVTVTRIAKPADAPTTSTHAIEIKNIGAASPGIGGFYQTINARANAKFVVRMIAKIPVGYTLSLASNEMGSGYSDKIITSNVGTGKYEEYIRVVTCGTTGTFSSGGHWALNGNVGTSTAPVTWYLAYLTAFDITDNDYTVNDVKGLTDGWKAPNSTAINGASIQTGTLEAGKITTGTLNAGLVTVTNLNASNITSGLLSANFINAKGLTVSDGTNNTFVINSAGNVTMIGTVTATAGAIGGMKLSGNTLYNGDKSTLTHANNGVYIGSDGIALGANSPFKVTNAGAMTVTNITATGGTVGGMTLSGSSMYSNSKSSLAHANAGIYIGTDGIALGANSPFKVTNAGVLTASGATLTSATVTGTITTSNISATGGKVGGFNINGDEIYRNSDAMGTSGGMYFGVSGLSVSDKFKVDSSGNVTASNLTINGGTIAFANITGSVPDNKIASAGDWNNTRLFVSAGSANTINANPHFLDWPSTIPVGYSGLTGTTLAKVTSGNGTGVAAKFTVAAGANVYLNPNTVSNLPYYQYITVEVTFMLESGTIDGAGVLFRVVGTASTDSYVTLKELSPAPTLGKWYTVSKVIKMASSTAPAGFTGYQVYPMGGWTSFGTVTAKTIQFDTMRVSPTSEQGINAYESDILTTTWRVGTTTEINGTSIKTGTFDAGKITTGALNASLITTGTLQAARINAKGLTVNNGSKNTLVIDSAGNITMDGVINSTSGTIGGMTLSGSSLYSNSKSSLAHANAGVYIGTDGISLGANSPFKVTNAGVLTATGATLTSATVTGTITTTNINATGGAVGGWTLSGNSIYRTNANYGTSGAMYFGTSGLSISDKFKVDSAGNATASSLTVTGGTISGTTINGGTVTGGTIVQTHNDGDRLEIIGGRIMASRGSDGSSSRFTTQQALVSWNSKTDSGYLTSSIDLEGYHLSSRWEIAAGNPVIDYINITNNGLSLQNTTDGKTIKVTLSAIGGLYLAKRGISEASSIDGYQYKVRDDLQFLFADTGILNMNNGTIQNANISGLTMKTVLDMGNFDITNANSITFTDPGSLEGVLWEGGNGWQIVESPNAMGNDKGNLQFGQGQSNTQRRATIDTNGNLVLYTNGGVELGRYTGNIIEITNSTGDYVNLYTKATEEVRVTKSGGGTTDYISMRGKSWINGSSIKYKQNLEEFTYGDAKYILDNTTPFKYHYNVDIERLTFDKPKVGMIAEMVPQELRDEDGVDTYAVSSVLWRVVQEQQKLIEALQGEIKDIQTILEVI